MFKTIYFPLVALLVASLLFGAKLFSIILGVSLAVAGVLAITLGMFQKYATVTPIDQPVMWEPLSDKGRLFAALLHCLLLVVLLTLIFA